MRYQLTKVFVLCFIALAIINCSDDDNGGTIIPTTIDRTAVMTTYADLVLANYQSALADAQTLESTLQSFVDAPSQTTFDAAKASWLTARESYGTSEAFRFANGPIDTGATEDIEGYLNSWPMDEAFVDYVAGDANAGIINNPTLFPTISKTILVGENGNGGEEKVSIGYHAIEFLLWGQDNTDPTESQAGLREFTDFVDGGTNANQDRRRAYLMVVADLITDHLQVMIDEWNGTYRATFLASSEAAALTDMINSISELSRSELAIERMAVALQNQDQEDEHSCFSDNTHRDIRLNLQGVANVYRGSFTGVTGPSIEDIVAEADAALAAELAALLTTAISTVNDTAIPFDLAIVGGVTSTEGVKVQAAVEALVAFGDKLLEAKTALGI
ncbi:MAG: putative iron-regulated protein [Dokdonia sp.]|jgi:putative iron-regulated protein